MKYTDICTLDAQGRIVIPTKMRKILNLVNQDSLEAELSGQEIHLRKCGEPPIDTHRLASFLPYYPVQQQPAHRCPLFRYTGR